MLVLTPRLLFVLSHFRLATCPWNLLASASHNLQMYSNKLQTRINYRSHDRDQRPVAPHTCNEELVAGDSLHHIQHVPCDGEVGALGLGLELMQRTGKEGRPLQLLQGLEGVVKPADVLRVDL